MQWTHPPRFISRGLAAALGAALLAACSEAPLPQQPQLEATAALASRGDDIREVLRRHTPGLMRNAGILGTGIRQGGEGESIVVYAMTPSHAAAAAIPKRLEGHGVDVVVTGMLVARDVNNPQTRERPAPNGFSVGHPDITAGTIGAKVKDNANNVYILSNNHVLANSNAASIGDPIYQPGPYDGGTAADAIGTLADFEPIAMDGSNNRMDAAISLVNGADLTGATPSYAYGAPSTTVYTGTVLNKGVQKFGRTTGHTTGTVTEVNVTVTVCYEPIGMFGCRASATFIEQIGISPGSFSAGGDSGSLIVTNDANRQPVALLFAGSSTRTLANPIGPVLQRFGVSIDNSGGSTDPDPDPVDSPPNAAFAYSCSAATCTFTDQSTDDQGVASWSWDFGSSGTSSAQNPTHTFSAGTHTVSLTVTDGAGQTDSASDTVTCRTRGKTLRCS